MLPTDATPEEKKILEHSIVNFYASLKRKEDMFLVAFCYDLGYKKSLAAQILGLSNGSITNRLKKIKKDLKNGYAKNRVED